MAIRLASHLHQNRYGVFYFRQTIPADLRSFFYVREIYLSLRTSRRQSAIYFTIPLVSLFHALFTRLRVMSEKEEPPSKPDAELDLIIRQFDVAYLRSFLNMKAEEELQANLPRGLARVLNDARIKSRLAARVAELEQEADNDRAQHKRDMDLLRSVVPVKAAPDERRGASSSIRDLFKKFCLAKRRGKEWKDPETAERYDYGPIIDEFINVLGDKPIGELTADDAQRYYETVLGKDDERAGNKDKKFNRVKALLNWARKKHYMEKDFSGILKLEGRDVNEHYEPFTKDELRKLFESRDYREHRFKKASHYWIPLIGAYTGARINEIAQLYVADIKDVDGIPAIDINDDDLKTTKNASSIRTVPIHPKLIEIGFLKYVKVIREEGYVRLFPEITKSSRAKDSFGKEPSRFFTKYRRACDVAPDVDRKKVFHSFRATSNSELRRMEVPQERRERLVGHCPEGINNKVYRPTDAAQLFKFSTLLNDLSKLDYGLVHPPYVPTTAHALARAKAATKGSGKHT